MKIIKLVGIALLLIACQADSDRYTDQADGQSSMDFSLPYEHYQLPNGLHVVLHQDNSDPIVALATMVHVGSNRERPGATGFAHFFEHMSFNDSENVPFGANRKLIEELGGTRNGGTWRDGTRYYEVVPKDAFDKLLWIDSDRLGYMINTVNEVALEREKQVVKNEKRERVDNQPYGHTDAVIAKALYPAGHPYSWTVIGELEDLQNATLLDVRIFYETYYVPSNATLVIAGDIDIEETKEKVANWFGEIGKGQPLSDPKPQPVKLSATKIISHLDTFAKVPEIRLTFPTVEEYHADSYALSVLGRILAGGKRAPLYKTIVVEKKLAAAVSAYQSSSEIAGTFTIRVRAFENTDLNSVKKALDEAMVDFETEGFDEKELVKIKNLQTRDFYASIETVLGKAFQLGYYNEYAGDPGFFSEDIARIKAVSTADVVRVYAKYIKNKPAIITGFVPESQPELRLANSVPAVVSVEQIVFGAERQVRSAVGFSYTKTATTFDRSEPPLAEPISFQSPQSWHSELSNGMKVYGIHRDEVPLVQFLLSVEGGQRLDQENTRGTAVLLAALLNEGTSKRTPAELEDAIQLLGSRIAISANADAIVVSGSTLAENFPATLALLQEMLLSPRWDVAEFDRLKRRRLNQIIQAKASPLQVGLRVFRRQLYGTEHINGQLIGGAKETVNNISLKSLKSYYVDNMSPKAASLYLAGDIRQEAALQALRHLQESWRGQQIKLPEYADPAIIEKPKLYFVDIPDAKQSVIIIGKPSLDGWNKDYYPLSVALNRLGGGSSARLFQTLRIEKGYTYGAYSSLQRSQQVAPFLARSQVRANVTLESLRIFQDLIGNYSATFTQSDLDKTKNLLRKRNARRYETLSSLVSLLHDIDVFDLPDNYLELQQQELLSLQLVDAKRLLDKYLDLENMIIVVVGDAATQLPLVNSLGLGDAIRLDRDGQLFSRD